MERVHSRAKIRLTFLVLICLVAGIVAALVSGFVQVAYGLNQDSGNLEWVYGFPFPWRALNGVPCVNPGGFPPTPSCLQSQFYSDDWWAFALDTMIYSLITFGLPLIYSRYRVRRFSSFRAS